MNPLKCFKHIRLQNTLNTIAERKKDPGVPNAAPFKEQILKEAEEVKRRLEEERQKQKEKRKRERQKILDKKRNLDSIVKDAQKRTDEFNKKVCTSNAVQWEITVVRYRQYLNIIIPIVYVSECS